MRRPLYGWLSADAISLTGTRVSMLALPWFVLTTTGSATHTGLVAFAEMAPLVLFKVLGGPVIDRVGARRIAIGCDLASFVVVGLVPLLHAAGLLTFPLLLAIVAVAGALRGPGDSAKDAMTPQIVALSAVPMERATGLASAVERTAGLVGFALAGALVAAVGPATALVVDAASFLVGAGVLAWATVGLRPARERAPDAEAATPGDATTPDRPRFWRELRAGWTYLRTQPVLLGLSLMIAVTNLLDVAWSAVLAPVWAHESGAGVGTLGAVFAVFAGCSAGGAVVASYWGERMPRFTIYVLAYLITGLPRFAAFAFDAPLTLLFAVTVIAGVASGFLNPILGAVFYERIPADLLGRVGSLSTAMCFALMPLGGLVGGLLITGLGLSPAFLLLGVAYLLTTLAPTVVPAFRQMEKVRPLATVEA